MTSHERAIEQSGNALRSWYVMGASLNLRQEVHAMTDTVTVEFLEAFAEAWNRHDTDAILSMMTSDCVFEASRGPEAKGKVYRGPDEVRAGIEEVFALFPDARWNEPRHFITGDRGVSEWVFTGTTSDGMLIQVQGCDVFTFRDGLISVKNSYRKQRIV
jgi:ketosteroid isomerase-like protein